MDSQVFFLFVFAVAIPSSVTAEYLKSSGDIKAVIGHEVTLNWMAYDNKERIQPCQFEYAANEFSPSGVLLAFELDEEYRPDKNTSWQFTEPNDPCAGGIKNNVSLSDTGIYMMMVERAHSVDVEHARTHLKVYDVKYLNFSVKINDQVHEILVKSGINVTLAGKIPDSQVDVVVELNEVFPNTTKVTIDRSVSDKTCDSSYRVLSCSLNLQKSDSIRVTVKTGIMGSDVITVVIPVDQEVHVNVAAIVLGILFVIAVGIIIFYLMCRLKQKNRERSL